MDHSRNSPNCPSWTVGDVLPLEKTQGDYPKSTYTEQGQDSDTRWAVYTIAYSNQRRLIAIYETLCISIKIQTAIPCSNYIIFIHFL